MCVLIWLCPLGSRVLLKSIPQLAPKAFLFPVVAHSHLKHDYIFFHPVLIFDVAGLLQESWNSFPFRQRYKIGYGVNGVSNALISSQKKWSDCYHKIQSS